MARLELTFDVTPVHGGDSVRVTARSPEIGQWEREFKGRSISRDLRINDFEEISWITMRQQRGYGENLATFRMSHVIDPVGEQDIARDEARERAQKDAVERGEEWTDADARKFDRQFDREWDGLDEDDEDGIGLNPTRKGRSAGR